MSGLRKWILTPADAEPTDIPDHVLDAILDAYSNQKRATAVAPEHGVAEGQRTNAALKMIGQKLTTIDVSCSDQVDGVWESVCQWNQTNKPPLDPSELRPQFDNILRREQDKRPPPARVSIPNYAPFPATLLPPPYGNYIITASRAIGCDAALIG